MNTIHMGVAYGAETKQRSAQIKRRIKETDEPNNILQEKTSNPTTKTYNDDHERYTRRKANAF